MTKKVKEPSSRKQTKYEFLRQDFDCKIDGLRETLKSHFKSITNNIFDNISEIQTALKSHKHQTLNPDLSSINHLIEHAQEGIEKCFERIEFVERALDNYLEYKTGIEDLETDVMYIKQRLDACETNYPSLWKRIEKLESAKLSEQLDPKVWKFLKEKVDQLETQIIKNIHLTLLLSPDSKQDNKKVPHKCPVCDGCARVLTEGAKVDFDGMLRADLPTGKDCNACEGKGILWG